MYLDILAEDSYGKYSRKIAQLSDLITAVYFSEILDIIKKVVKKGTYDENGFFTLDRDYIESRTTITMEDQVNCDSILATVGILTKSDKDINKIKVDLEKAVAIMIDEDPKRLEAVAKKMRLSRTAEAKNKQQIIMNVLKSGIVETNDLLLQALRNWVDGVYANKRYLTKRNIEIFQETIKRYSSDLNIQIKITEIATINGWTDAAWAISDFERNYLNKSNLYKQSNGTTSGGTKSGVEF